MCHPLWLQALAEAHSSARLPADSDIDHCTVNDNEHHGILWRIHSR